MGRGSGPGSQQAPGGPSGQGKPGPLPFDPLSSQRFPNFPLRAWDPFLSPSHPSGRQSHPASIFPPPSLPPHLMSYPVTGGSSCYHRCLWSPHQCLAGALVVQRREFHILLLLYLDSASIHFSISIQWNTIEVFHCMDILKCILAESR